MKLPFEKQKTVEAVGNIIQKTSDISKKMTEGVQTYAKNIADKSQNENYLRRLKKYNPLFPEQYFSDEFNIPNMIVIVDDAVRRGIDVCEGAIGWIKQENGMEILCLYDEAIEISGIKFVPDAQCDAIYYVDRFDRNRFIKIECLYSRAQEEKIAELEHIAYCLGAKCCSVEISESNIASNEQKRKISLKQDAQTNIGKISSKEESDMNSFYKSSNQKSGRGMIKFQGNNTPKYPELKWFQHDDNIKRLIEMRCEGGNIIESKVLELEGASTAVMSLKAAHMIDSTVSKMVSMKGSTNLENKAAEEHHSKFIFSIEF